MTEDMNVIARKTKIETVSMKAITLVTMFFLPGTFISVGGVKSSFLGKTALILLYYSLLSINQNAMES